MPTSNRRSLALVTLLLATATVAACGGGSGGSSSAPTTPSGTTPAGSGTVACATAPDVPDDLEGWGPPASAPAVTPLIIASPGQLVCGHNRVLFTLIDASSRPVGAPDKKVTVGIYDLARDPNSAIASEDGSFVWAIENERGVYIVNADFPEAGRYGAAFSVNGGEPIRLTFDVQPSSSQIRIGDRAPASRTPTLESVGGDATKISTDADPDPAFYQTSVDEAIADHKPFLLVFATPKFCTSAQCGPTLDSIKPYVAKYPTVTFINVEPYKLKLVDGALQADLDANGQLQTTAVTDAWHLFNEPTIYVVDRDGVVTANFDLIFSEAELTTALDAVK